MMSKPKDNINAEDLLEEQKWVKEFATIKSNQKNINLVFIGQTGAGKSTLVESIGDYINGTDFRNIKTKKISSFGKSQTRYSSTHQFENKDYKVTILDTPGLGDTQGLLMDKKHIDDILQKIIRFNKFNAICFVMKSSENRKGEELEYIINSLKQFIPKKAEQLFLVISTRSESVVSKNLSQICSDLRLNNQILPVNNGAYEDFVHPTNQKDLKEIFEEREEVYNLNKRKLKKILDITAQMPLFSSAEFEDLQNKKNMLKNLIDQEQSQIINLEHEEQALENLINQISEAERSKNNNSDWNKPIYYTKTVPDTSYPYKQLYCQSCWKICHNKCQVNEGEDALDCIAFYGIFNIGYFNKSFRSSACGACGCLGDEHLRRWYRMKGEVVVLSYFDESKKLQFKNAEDQIAEFRNKKQQVEKTIQDKKEQKVCSYKKIASLFKEIKANSLVQSNDFYKNYLRKRINDYSQQDKNNKNQNALDYLKSELRKIENEEAFLNKSLKESCNE